MDPLSERIGDYARSLERSTVERECPPGPGASGADRRRPGRTAARILVVGCLAALLVGAGLLVSRGRDQSVVAVGRPDPSVGPGRSDPLPYLTFLPDGSAPATPWVTTPYITGLQEYNVSEGNGRTRRFRYVAFSQRRAFDSTPSQTITLVLSDAADGDFDRAKLTAMLACSETVNIQGGDAVVGIDPLDGSLVFVWRVEEGVAAVVSVRGYDRASALELIRHLGYADGTWSKVIEGVPAVRNANDRDANWRYFERFRTGDVRDQSPATTLPTARPQACP